MVNAFKSPQQQIFDTLFKTSINLGYRTFDFLPANDVAYPFVYIGEQFDQDRNLKDVVIGEVQQTIHIYHTQRNRRSLTDMMDNLKTEIRKLKKTENFEIRASSITAQTLPDNSTSAALLHGIVEVTIKFN